MIKDRKPFKQWLSKWGDADFYGMSPDERSRAFKEAMDAMEAAVSKQKGGNYENS